MASTEHAANGCYVCGDPPLEKVEYEPEWRGMKLERTYLVPYCAWCLRRTDVWKLRQERIELLVES